MPTRPPRRPPRRRGRHRGAAAKRHCNGRGDLPLLKQPILVTVAFHDVSFPVLGSGPRALVRTGRLRDAHRR